MEKYGIERFKYLLRASLGVEVMCVASGQARVKDPMQGFKHVGEIVEWIESKRAEEVERIRRWERAKKITPFTTSLIENFVVIFDEKDPVGFWEKPQEWLPKVAEVVSKIDEAEVKGRLIEILKSVKEELEANPSVYGYRYLYKALAKTCWEFKIDIGVEYKPLPRVTLCRIGNKVVVKGDTYPIRDALKASGGKWDPNEEAWIFSKVPDLEGVADYVWVGERIYAYKSLYPPPYFDADV